MIARIRVVDGQTIAGTGNYTSEAVCLENSQGNFSLDVQISGTAPNVKAEYLLCDTRDGTFKKPSAASDIDSSITASDVCGFDPPVNKWMKIKITGNGTNGADTVVTARLLFDEVFLNTI